MTYNEDVWLSKNIEEAERNDAEDNTKIPGISIELPEIYANPKYRFVRLGFHSKKRIDDNIYSYNDPVFKKHLLEGNNYGVLNGFGGHFTWDVDVEEKETMEQLKAVLGDNIPTATTKTGKKFGVHFQYDSDDMEKIKEQNPWAYKSAISLELNGKHVGELRYGIGSYVVGPGSIHPNGSTYKLLGKEITQISFEYILKHLDPIIPDHTKNYIPPKLEREYYSSDSSDLHFAVPIDKIAYPDHAKSGSNGEIHGVNPEHGHLHNKGSTGSNFSINTRKNTFYCFSCEAGGGWIDWWAIKTHRISCNQAGTGAVTGQMFKDILNEAREDGYKIPGYKPREYKHEITTCSITEKRLCTTEIPSDLPDKQVIVIRGPPRIGKTHNAMRWLVQSGRGNYVTNRHSIIEHALRIFSDLGGEGAVWLEGKFRDGMCRYNHDCENCPLIPKEDNYVEMQHESRNLLYECGILTKDQVPEGMCPYFTLRLAEPFADYTFTVVNYIDEITKRELLVLDEDGTIGSFYPSEAPLMKLVNHQYEYRIRNVMAMNLGLIDEKHDRLLKLKTKIEEKERPNSTDAHILQVSNLLYAVSDTITNLIKNGIEDNDKIKEELSNILKNRPELTKSETISLVNALEEYDKTAKVNSENVNIIDYFLAVLYPFDANMLPNISLNGQDLLVLMPDGRIPLIRTKWMDKLEKYDRVVMIGGVNAEYFAENFEDHVIIDINEFKYAKNFVVIPINTEQQVRPEKKIYSITRRYVVGEDGDVGSLQRKPCLVLTGSKRGQYNAKNALGDLSFMTQDGLESTQSVWNHRGFAGANIFYANSVMARGLDVPDYNVMFVRNIGFATPFWSAAIEAYNMRSNLEKYNMDVPSNLYNNDDRCEGIRNAILEDEALNCCLRMTPIGEHGNDQPKVIFIADSDVWKLEKYLKSQVVTLQDVKTSLGLESDEDDYGFNKKDLGIFVDILRQDNIGSTIIAEDGISNIETEIKGDWEEAVKEGKLKDYIIGRYKDVVEERDSERTEKRIIKDAGKIVDVLDKVKSSRSEALYKASKIRSREYFRAAIAKLYHLGVVKVDKKGRSIIYTIVEDRLYVFEEIRSPGNNRFNQSHSHFTRRGGGDRAGGG